MIRNVKYKKFLKTYIFPVFSVINKIVPKKDEYILLYSGSFGIVGALRPLKNYLLDNKYNVKYKIYCGIEDLKFKDDEPRVSFITHLRSLWIYMRSGHVFYTDGQLPIKPAKNQIVIQLWHGVVNYKTIGKWSNINNGDEYYFTYMCASSDLYVPIQASEYGCEEKYIKPIGDVLVDELLDSPKERKVFVEFDKLLLWFPTFRQSDFLGYDDSTMETIVPLFKEEDYPQLNEYLKKYNIKLIVKPHSGQNNYGSLPRHFSHFDVYSDSEFLQTGMKTYPILAQADGLVGDYSSISMHFTLLDKPMAFVVPDIEEYGKKRGFVFKNPEDYMGGHIIKTQEEFFKFIDDFAQNKDVYCTKRRWVCDQCFKYKDANNRKRAVELSGLYL